MSFRKSSDSLGRMREERGNQKGERLGKGASL